MEYSPRYERFRALLRTIREEAGLSQAALAKKLGKPQSFVSKSEIGERLIDFLETVDFCTACSMPVTQFTERLQKGVAAEAAWKKKRSRRSKPTITRRMD